MTPQLLHMVQAVITDCERRAHPLGTELRAIFPRIRPVSPPEYSGPVNPGRLAFFLWQRLSSQKARHIGDLVLDVYDHFGHGGLEEINAVLGELIALGFVERVTLDRGTCYRRTGDA